MPTHRISLAIVFIASCMSAILLPPNCVDAQEELSPPEFSKKQLSAAEKLIKELFKQEYKEKKAKWLAKTLFEQSRKIKDDPDVRYVALLQARDLAAAGGDWKLAFDAIGELSLHHKIDVAQMKIGVLASVVKNYDNGELLRKAATLAFKLSNDAGDADNYTAAARLGKIALAAAQKGKHADLSKTFRARIDELLATGKAFAKIQPLITKLKTNPLDGPANLEVGKFWCFVRDKWERGLPHLAKSNDAALKRLAAADANSPNTGAKQIQLADGWWKLAQSQKGTIHLQMLRRSFLWYRQAAVLVQGKSKAHAQARLKQLEKALPARLRVTDISTVLRVFTGHQSEVLSVAFVPGSRHIVSCSADRTLRLWDYSTGKQVRVFKGHLGTVFGVAATPDGKYILSGGEDRTVRLWELATAKEKRRFTGQLDQINSVTISADGKHAAAGSQDRNIYIWNIATGKLVHKLSGHGGAVFRVAFSSDGKFLASASDDQSIRVWNLKSGKQVKKLTGHAGQALAVAYSPDGKRLLSSGEDQSVRLWELATGKELRQFKEHKEIVGSIAFSPSGLRFLSASDDRSIRLWNVTTGQSLRTLKGHTDAVYGIVFSPDGRYALSCSLDKTIRLWGERK